MPCDNSETFNIGRGVGFTSGVGSGVGFGFAGGGGIGSPVPGPAGMRPPLARFHSSPGGKPVGTKLGLAGCNGKTVSGGGRGVLLVGGLKLVGVALVTRGVR